MILTLYGFEIVAEPFSVKSDSSSANRALARSIESPVVSTQPDPRFSLLSVPCRPTSFRAAAADSLAPACTKQQNDQALRMHFSLSCDRAAPCSSFPAQLPVDPGSARHVRTGENANRVFFGVANEAGSRIASLGVGLRLQNTVVIARSTLSAICKMP